MGFMNKFKQAASAATPTQQAGGAMPGMPTADDAAMMQKLQRLNAVGVEVPATIRGLQATGRTDMGGGAEHQVTVDVAPAGGAPYQASFTQFMHVPTMSGWAFEGAEVNVKVDPEDPNSMILWGGRQ